MVGFLWCLGILDFQKPPRRRTSWVQGSALGIEGFILFGKLEQSLKLGDLSRDFFHPSFVSFIDVVSFV